MAAVAVLANRDSFDKNLYFCEQSWFNLICIALDFYSVYSLFELSYSKFLTLQNPRKKEDKVAWCQIIKKSILKKVFLVVLCSKIALYFVGFF